jgi:CHAT domain-containing protein
MAQVAELFASAHEGAGVALLQGGEASETAFRNAAPAHRFAHLATHGFFVGGPGARALEPRASPGTLADPSEAGILHPGVLAGIAFAGANARRGEEQDDGILTALEMASLDLGGVELLTLSACETGLGAAAGGEGLLGLQRAAQISGARAVLASLWKVDDEGTRELMGRFYANLWQQGLPRAEALRAAQLAMLRERRPVRDWGAWVLSGDWR